MYRIDMEKCYLCGLCFDICATEAVTFSGIYEIDKDLCIECGECYEYCVVSAIVKEE